MESRHQLREYRMTRTVKALLLAMVVVCIAGTSWAAIDKDEIYTQVYDVKDFPVFKVTTNGTAFDATVLVTCIQASVDPKSWAASGTDPQIVAFEENHSLVISQTQANHEKVALLLEKMRKPGRQHDEHDLITD